MGKGRGLFCEMDLQRPWSSVEALYALLLRLNPALFGLGLLWRFFSVPSLVVSETFSFILSTGALAVTSIARDQPQGRGF